MNNFGPLVIPIDTLSWLGKLVVYPIYPRYWNRQAQANCVDPDQMPHFAASDLGWHCSFFIQLF